MKRRRTTQKPKRAATQKSNHLLVSTALKDNQRVKGKTLVAIDGEPNSDRKAILGVTQSREGDAQGYAFVVFKDKTYATLMLTQSITVE